MGQTDHTTAATSDEEAVRIAKLGAQLLEALFAPDDLVLFRPIESWTEDGRKRSRTDYRNTSHSRANAYALQMTILRLASIATKTFTNLYFGVCPRVGDKGRFDLAWQIRTIRALWADVDHTSVEDALQRVRDAGLPEPSIVVHTGNGAHLYWLLKEPFLVDDAGDPPPVETEWVQSPGGKKEAVRYLLEEGDRVYLHQRRHISRLSPKACHVQNVLAGISQLIGGDHTTDLARILRIPGPPNRKNQRNGTEPISTALNKCDAGLKYDFNLFEGFAQTSAETIEAERIAAMPLPRARKLSAAKTDDLNELIAASKIAAAGKRSEADFAVCCQAIRSGLTKEELWPQVEQVGKFADQGRRYFDLTWDNAEFDVRASIYDKLTKRAQKPEATATPPHPMEDGQPPEEGNCDGVERSTIAVDASTTTVGETLHAVTDRLLAAGNCFSRAEQLVTITGERIQPILSTAELAGLLNQHVEFYFIGEKFSEYKPLPAAYGGVWLNQHVERARLPIIKLFTHNPVYTEDWRLIAPGFDAGSGIYYAGKPIVARQGTVHLDRVLKDFCFRRPADRTNYIGILLTALLVPRFLGCKPAALFNGNQPGLGKSMLAQLIAILRDGRPTETISYNPNDEEFEKRLGASVHRGVTTLIIDNAKARGRNARIESPCLERSITDPILSFRLLGYSREIRAENSHIFCITANAADVSRDLVTRSAPINLFLEGDPARRTFTLPDPEGYAQEHREELLGELIGMVEKWKVEGMPEAQVNSRFNKRGWGRIVGGILATNGEPDFLANAEEAAVQLDETRREFEELVGVVAADPSKERTATELARVCSQHGLLKDELGERSARSRATRLGVLASRFVGERFELSEGRTGVFARKDDRDGKLYRVEIESHLRNVEASAEPLRNAG